MTFAKIANGTDVFVDANVFVYTFAPEPQLGPPSAQLLERIEHQELRGFTSTHVLSNVAHRLMALEACAVFGWPFAGIAQRLKRHPAEIQQLSRYQPAVDAILAMGVQAVPIVPRHVQAGGAISRRYGIMTNDALIVALMTELNLQQLASNDSDFDRVPTMARFTPH